MRLESQLAKGVTVVKRLTAQVGIVAHLPGQLSVVVVVVHLPRQPAPVVHPIEEVQLYVPRIHPAVGATVSYRFRHVLDGVGIVVLCIGVLAYHRE